MSRSRFVLLAMALIAGLVLISPSGCLADAASDLAEAEAEQASAASEVAAAQRTVKQAEAALSPVAAKAEAADQALLDEEDRVEQVKEGLVSERRAAAQEIEAGEAAYDDEKSSHDATAGIGIAIALLSIGLAAGAFAYSKFRKWPFSRSLTQALAGALALVFIGGIVLAVAAPSPSRPEFSKETLELADQAKGDPADPATPALLAAEAKAERLKEKAQPLDTAQERAQRQLEKAEGAAEGVESKLTSAEQNVHAAEKEIAHLEAIAEEETRFREEATTIDYKQLIKNPDAYKGEKVVYTGQVLQIQEYGGLGFMLLSVTDEGYGFWTDNIWVDFEEHTEVAEEDIITVYGKITGSEEYETQIGGSTYVPKMRAKYIDE